MSPYLSKPTRSKEAAALAIAREALGHILRIATARGEPGIEEITVHALNKIGILMTDGHA